MSLHELGPVPAAARSSNIEVEDSKAAKDVAFDANVIPVYDAEAGSDKPVYDGKERYDMVIPEGVDPNLMPHEDVRRGLKQRHIQVRPCPCPCDQCGHVTGLWG